MWYIIYLLHSGISLSNKKEQTSNNLNGSQKCGVKQRRHKKYVSYNSIEIPWDWFEGVGGLPGGWWNSWEWQKCFISWWYWWLHEYTFVKTHLIVHWRFIHFIICKLCHSETDLKEKNGWGERQEESELLRPLLNYSFNWHRSHHTFQISPWSVKCPYCLSFLALISVFLAAKIFLTDEIKFQVAMNLKC